MVLLDGNVIVDTIYDILESRRNKFVGKYENYLSLLPKPEKDLNNKETKFLSKYKVSRQHRRMEHYLRLAEIAQKSPYIRSLEEQYTLAKFKKKVDTKELIGNSIKLGILGAALSLLSGLDGKVTTKELLSYMIIGGALGFGGWFILDKNLLESELSSLDFPLEGIEFKLLERKKAIKGLENKI